MPERLRWTRSKAHASLLSTVVLCVSLGLAVAHGASAQVSDASATHAKPLASATPYLSAADTCAHAAAAPNPVLAENQCAGTSSWRLDHPLGDEHAIEAFTAPSSVVAGERVQLYVSTSAPTYAFAIYRMGWYQGLGARLIYQSAQLPGILQPAPTIDPATRMVRCDTWHDPVTIAVSPQWVSGVYVVKLVSASGYMRYASFVVREDAHRSAMLFFTADLTYQAYNLWGGYSLYFGLNTSGSGPEYTRENRAYQVSFDRPYSVNAGLSNFMPNEYDLLRWLERQGYDLAYASDLDTASRASLLSHHRLLIFSGHDEYWSTAMRANVTRARDAGVSLAFFGANDIYWHVRLQNSPLGANRVITCYKDAQLDPLAPAQPKEATTLWREPPVSDPEDSLTGQGYGGQAAASAPLTLGAGAAPWLQGTGLKVGASLPGLVGGEFDRLGDPAARSNSVVVLASSSVRCVDCVTGEAQVSTATLYIATSGAKVFDAGTFQWSWGLDDERFNPALPARSYSNSGFQAFTAHLLASLLVRATSGLVPGDLRLAIPALVIVLLLALLYVNAPGMGSEPAQWAAAGGDRGLHRLERSGVGT